MNETGTRKVSSLLSRALAVGLGLFSSVAAQPPNDTHFSKQWYLRNTGLHIDTGAPDWQPEADVQILEAWTITKGSPRVVVAIVDGGMDLDHGDLVGNLLPRGTEDWDFYCDFPVNLPCSCTPDNSPDELNGGHGTSVAGIAGATRGNALGIAGVAPECRIMPLRTRIGPGFNINRANAISAAANKLLSEDVDAVAINCSWKASVFGYNDCCTEVQGNECDLEDRINLENAIIAAHNMGAVVVCSAGNRELDQGAAIDFPASMPQTIAVGASDACDLRWNYQSTCPNFRPDGSPLLASQTGPELDVVAPGGYRMWTTALAGGYWGIFGGTSAAAPIVTGIAALILSVNSTLNPTQVHDILRVSAEDLVGDAEDTPGRDNYMGYGRVNAYRAVQLAAGWPSPTYALIDVTRRALSQTGSSEGVAWGDYDGDGDEDLYLCKAPGADKLLRNDGAEIFKDITPAPLGDTGHGRAAGWADYDNDGDVDLYLVKDSAANKLYRNESGGVFTEITSAPLGDTGPGQSFAWLDYDNDGRLDIYLVNKNAASKLFRNVGCSFQDVTTSPLNSSGPGCGVACGDYDGDADQDIYLVNNGAANKLFRNNGGGSFTDVTPTVLQGTTSGQCAAWGDFDNDTDLDLLLVSRGGNRLYRNDGGGSFTDVTSGPIDGNDDVRGGEWFDYDNDGDLDIYLTRDGAVGNSLLRNDGWTSTDVTFTDVTVGPLGSTAAGRGVAMADYDSDGDVDLYLVNSGASSKLFRNHAAAGKRWLRVKLVGKDSNRSAIGARVRVVTGSTSRIREVSGGQGYRSQGSLPVEFGLGSATTADLIEVRWPGGTIQTLTSQTTNQVVTITECRSGTPAIVESTMLAWSEGNPDPSYMTLHFTFSASLRADEFEVQYRPVGGSWVTLVCSSPSSSCIFDCDGSYERTASYMPCDYVKFQWRARAKNCNGWASSYSSIKTFDALCLQEP